MVGDVVLTPFPFTDLSQVKIRPAVVLAGVGMQDWVLCEVTSSSQVRGQYIAIGPADMVTGILKLESWARPDRLTTLNDTVFTKRLGRLSAAKHAEIAAAVRSLF